MLSRCSLNGQPCKVFQSPVDHGVHITIWNMEDVRAGVHGTHAYIQTELEYCTPNFGTPIPPNGMQFTIWLEAGEILWGVAYNEALLGVSVGP